MVILPGLISKLIAALHRTVLNVHRSGYWRKRMYSYHKDIFSLSVEKIRFLKNN